MVLLFCSDWVLFKRCPSPHRFTLEQTHIPTLQICFHTDAAYKQCNSVVMRLFGFSLQVCGALFPHVWQDGDLFLHRCLLRPVVNKLTNCKCNIYPWRVCVYSVCSYLFLSVLSSGWTCGSWVPGRVTCAGWCGSWPLSEPPTSSSSMRGQFRRASF